MPTELRPALSPFQVETISLFVNIASVMSLPKSIGEIYGLLFSTEEPLSLDDIIERLQMSRGSASEGTRWLRSTGAIKMVYLPGVRKDHFTAETELRRLAAGFLRDRIEPHLQNAPGRIETLKEAVGKDSSTFVRDRLGKLQNWHSFAKKVLPLVKALAGKF